MSRTKYERVIEYLFEQLPMYQRVGKQAVKKDLTNTRALCRALDHPERRLTAVHIAGTNGKGSVSHLLAAPLQEMGLKVGLYSSPHYRDFRERIKINGRYIERESVVGFVEENSRLFEEIRPSFFEITVAMAFWYFAEQAVDFAIVETGLGGRLDSTNVIDPILSIITNIGYDHQDMLGDSLAEIAWEKAGIIKPSRPVLIGEHQDETDGVFVRMAREQNAHLWFAKELCTVKKVGQSEGCQNVSITWGADSDAIEVEVEALGTFQLKNIRTAFAGLMLLDKFGHIQIPVLRTLETAWKELRAHTAFKGRFQLISEAPAVLVDSAHNTEGLRSVLEDLEKISYDRLHIVMGLVREKNPSDILALFPQRATYYFCRPDIPRGMPVDQLMNAARAIGLKGSHYTSVNKALDAAKSAAGKKDLIFVGGSTYTVAEVV